MPAASAGKSSAKFPNDTPMSRIGKKPIVLPAGVTAEVKGTEVTVKGPKGFLTRSFDARAAVQLAEQDGAKSLNVSVAQTEDPFERALWGTVRAILANAVTGVTQGFSKALEINGVGYRVAQKGRTLVFTVGYSHDVEIELPVGIEAKIEKNIVTLTGIDRQLLGETAAKIRAVRPPEPYLGKGIKYVDEVLRRKAGKAATKAAE